MILLDCLNYKKVITPFTVITTVYFILINLNNLWISDIYGFYKVSADSLKLLLLLFAIIFAVDILFGRIFFKTGREKLPVEEVLNDSAKEGDAPLEEWKRYLVSILFAIGLGAYVLSFVFNYWEYDSATKGHNNGILGHLSYIAFILAPVYFGIFWKKGFWGKVLAVGGVLAMLGIAVMFRGKYVILINFVYLLFCYLMTKKKSIKIGTLLLVTVGTVVTTVFVFFMVYAAMPRFWGSKTEILDLIEHAKQSFWVYLISPISSNNYTLFNFLSRGKEIVFCVPINVFKAIFGGIYVRPVHQKVFGYMPGKLVNVSGILGESVYCLGLFGAILYLVAIFVAANTLYVAFRKFKMYPLTTCYLLAVFLFGFFCNFFTVSGVVLPLAYLFIIETIFDWKKIKKVIKRIQKRRATLKALRLGRVESDENAEEERASLAVVVLNFNGTDDTIECLQSLKENKERYTLFLLDNGSSEEEYKKLETYVKESGFAFVFCKDETFDKTALVGAQLYLISSAENRGFAKGNNFVVERIHKEYDYVLLLNNDTILPSGSVESMLACIKRAKNVALSCDIRYEWERETLWNAGGEFKWYGDRKYYPQKKIDRLIKRGVKYIPAEFITGCAMMVDCRYIASYGLFTEKFFHGEEDYHFCKEVCKRGGTLGVDLGARLYHKVGRSLQRATDKDKQLRGTVLHYTNRMVDYKQYYNKITFKLWRGVYLTLVAIKRKLGGASLKEVKLICAKVRAYSDAYDHVQKEVFLRIMNDGEITSERI